MRLASNEELLERAEKAEAEVERLKKRLNLAEYYLPSHAWDEYKRQAEGQLQKDSNCEQVESKCNEEASDES